MTRVQAGNDSVYSGVTRGIVDFLSNMLEP